MEGTQKRVVKPATLGARGSLLTQGHLIQLAWLDFERGLPLLGRPRATVCLKLGARELPVRLWPAPAVGAFADHPLGPQQQGPADAVAANDKLQGTRRLRVQRWSCRSSNTAGHRFVRCGHAVAAPQQSQANQGQSAVCTAEPFQQDALSGPASYEMAGLTWLGCHAAPLGKSPAKLRQSSLLQARQHAHSVGYWH